MIVPLTILILCIPTVYNLITNRNGRTAKQKRKDVVIRVVMIIVFGVLTALIRGNYKQPFDEIFMSFAIFFLVFDYAITTILIHRGIIETKEGAFSYVGKTSKMDKAKLWVRIGAWGRFAVKMIVFIASLLFYF